MMTWDSLMTHIIGNEDADRPVINLGHRFYISNAMQHNRTNKVYIEICLHDRNIAAKFKAFARNISWSKGPTKLMWLYSIWWEYI